MSTQAVPDSSKRLHRAYWVSTIFAFLSPLAALACLRQWGTPHPWSRLDVFSGGFIVVSTLAVILVSFGFNRAVFRSMSILREAAGLNYDPRLVVGSSFLAALDMTLYLDYGHWRLVPSLARPPLQWAGLVLAVAATTWVLWTDRHLINHFRGDLEHRVLMTGGPFRFVRHPRYSSILFSRAAIALALASILGWILALAWGYLILRRIRLEEIHLREIFGAQYETYAARTWRLLPGIY